MTRACIVGWAHTPFGKLDDPDVESLLARVSGEALTHAGVAADQLDGIYVGCELSLYPGAMPMSANS